MNIILSWGSVTGNSYSGILGIFVTLGDSFVTLTTSFIVMAVSTINPSVLYFFQDIGSHDTWNQVDSYERGDCDSEVTVQKSNVDNICTYMFFTESK